jgi:hypothetical protein
MGSTTLNDKHESRHSWIKTLLTQQNLVEAKRAPIDHRSCWATIEESRLLERIRTVVGYVNATAGYDLLELLDFLPPQTTVLRIAFSKRRREYIMDIECRKQGAAVVFYLKQAQNRFFANHSRRRSSTTFLDMDFLAAEILEKDIVNWLSYLLSGFRKRFQPGSQQPSAENSASQLHTLALDSIASS